MFGTILDFIFAVLTFVGDRLSGEAQDAIVTWVSLIGITVIVKLQNLIRAHMYGVGDIVLKHQRPSFTYVRRSNIARCALFCELEQRDIRTYFWQQDLEGVADSLAQDFADLNGVENKCDSAGLQPLKFPNSLRVFINRELSTLETSALLKANGLSVEGVGDLVPYSPFLRSSDGSSLTRKGRAFGPAECTFDVKKFNTILEEVKIEANGKPDPVLCSKHIRMLALWLASSSDVLTREELTHIIVEMRAHELEGGVNIVARYGDNAVATYRGTVAVLVDGDMRLLNTHVRGKSAALTKTLDSIGRRVFYKADRKIYYNEENEYRELSEHNASLVPTSTPRLKRVVRLGGVEVMPPGRGSAWMQVPDTGVMHSDGTERFQEVTLEYRAKKVRVRKGNSSVQGVNVSDQTLFASYQWRANASFAPSENDHFRDIAKAELEWLLKGVFGSGGVALGLKLLHDNCQRFRCDRGFSQTKSCWWFDRRESVDAEIPLVMLDGLMVLVDERDERVLLPVQHTDSCMELKLHERHDGEIGAAYVHADLSQMRLAKLRVLDGDCRSVGGG